MYRIVHVSGMWVGPWFTYDEADCQRLMMDDWEDWTVDIVE